MVPNEATSRAGAARLTRADVTDAALELLDTAGLPELSMRRIAGVLGVQPSALYWHFANKQTLLAAVSARILGVTSSASHDSGGGDAQAASEVVSETSGDWQASFVAQAEALRSRLLAHRDGAELVSSSFALGLVEFPARAELIRLAQGGGVATELAATAADTGIHFVLGYTFFEQQRLQADALGAASESVALSAESAAHAAVTRPDEANTFASGLALIVAGIDASVRR